MLRHWNSLVNKPKLLFFLLMNLCRGIVHKLFEINAWSVKQETPMSDQVTSSAWNCIHHLKRAVLRGILRKPLAKLLKLPSMFEVVALKVERKVMELSQIFIFSSIRHWVSDGTEVKRRSQADWFAATNFMISIVYTTCCLTLSVTSLITWDNKR